MPGTDSVSVFAEGTFEEQIQELVNYIVRNRSEEERVAFIRPFQEALKTPEGQTPLEEDAGRKRSIFHMVAVEVKSLGDGTDKEMEGFFNLLFSHLFALHSHDGSDTKSYVDELIQLLTQNPSQHQFVKYRILANLFNAMERTSSLRPVVYTALVQMASSNGDLDVLQITRVNVEKWLSEWNISDLDKATFLKTISGAYETMSQPEKAYEYERLYVRALPSTSQDAQDGAVNLIASALRLPTVFDFDPLFKLDAVVQIKHHELFSLLQIFLSGALPEFKAWEQSHPDVLQTYKLDRTVLERKIRLLTLASLAFQHVGRDLPYSKVAEALQVETQEVEKWAIDVIRAGLVWGKLSQTTQSLHVTRATARTFEKEQWEALEKRLLAWKSGLGGVLDVVVSAKRQAGLGQPQNAV
ncbi:putative component of the eukaryotic translation initiation factor 3 (eIF-3) complex [Lyophyllum shimeji]|uniref:Eukaryotic translation initiation factor 3 subunit M n=1 Tax=Lyophyllum shimeji TaxID=47721 RepID=A0A9P3PE02_LYOSH|nr:putative component of the eukaryotic translation initiation factor 3 (eIF-3) complex [Lyophyllum shimeji]